MRYCSQMGMIFDVTLSCIGQTESVMQVGWRCNLLLCARAIIKNCYVVSTDHRMRSIILSARVSFIEHLFSHTAMTTKAA